MSRWHQGPRPEGGIRRSQLLTRAGPGALVDLVDDAVLITGLDDWRYRNEKEGFIREPRLEASALRMLQGIGWNHGQVRLRLPPPCDDDEPSPKVGVPAMPFPSWHLCQNGRCRSLVHTKALAKGGRHVCADNDAKSFPVVPLRFVASCARGHLADVYWRWFVHRGEREEGLEEGEDWAFCHRQPGSGRENDPLKDHWLADLYMVDIGTSGDLSDFVVGCRRCGATRGLQDLATPGNLGKCKGWRPWLGHNAGESCDLQQRLLIRTASNAYFPQFVSALAIPAEENDLRTAVEQHWDYLREIDSADVLATMIPVLPPLRASLGKRDPGEVFSEIVRIRQGVPASAKRIREVEWERLHEAPVDVGELPARDAKWFARRADLDLPSFLDRVVLVHSLTEVRAQVGFTRLDGYASNAEGEFRLDGQRSAPLALRADWIPAVEIRGEGLFLAFNEQAIRAWEALDAVQQREEQFRKGLELENRNRTIPAQFEGARLLLLHTVAHLLITQISLECGYPAASIRERIYCFRDTHQDPVVAAERSRAGILLYTGTPGSEGTLGGLVEVGRDIVRHLRAAAEQAQLCSNDPVCAQHDPDGFEEGRAQEGAACHGCVLIAEPSCERMNRDLDRTMVVPTVQTADAAFLGRWLGVGSQAPHKP